MSNLGLFLFETGRVHEAVQPLRKAVAMGERVSGKGSRSWAVPAYNLAAALRRFEETRAEGEALAARARAALNL